MSLLGRLAMRIVVAVSLLVLVSPSAQTQQPVQNPSSPQAQKFVYSSAADIAAAVAKMGNAVHGAQRLVSLPPFNVSIEHRTALDTAASHDLDAELYYIVDGAGTLVTGGELVEPKRTNPTNWSGSAIKGGDSRRVAKGDVMLIAEGVPHWFSALEGSISVMTLHLPRGAAQK